MSAFYKISRNMQECNGDKSCGCCLGLLPNLAEGDIELAEWALNCNKRKIDEAINHCPLDPPAIRIVPV